MSTVIFQTVEYVCIDNMKMESNFYQTSVLATCLDNNLFQPPTSWPICKPSKDYLPVYLTFYKERISC